MKKHYENEEIKVSIDYENNGVRKIFSNLIFKSERELENFLLTLQRKEKNDKKNKFKQEL